MVDNSLTTFGQDLAYDLRQIYARIVGEHLSDIAEARKSDQFYAWYKNLEDLHTIVKHKFKAGKQKYTYENKQIEQTAEERYQSLIKYLVELANKYPNVWNGQTKEATPFAEIDTALRNIEMFLYEQMNEAKMFGSSGRIEGL